MIVPGSWADGGSRDFQFAFDCSLCSSPGAVGQHRCCAPVTELIELTNSTFLVNIIYLYIDLRSYVDLFIYSFLD
jgi:hypothetical protein